jgi:3-hydroxy-D-aspartate aldolase
MTPITREEMETPALLIDLDLLENNIATIAKFINNKKAKLHPHFKTHKCPTISHKQINAGAKGITCAKLGEAETLVLTGIRDVLIANIIWTEIQAGSYIFMDTIYERLGLDFKNALSILATVIHKRPGMAVTDAGLKVCSTEQGLPRIKKYPHLKFHDELSEEHGTIIDPRDELTYLKKIEYIPSHCCTTVNLHDHFYCMRNGYLESVWPISARGKSQ